MRKFIFFIIMMFASITMNAQHLNFLGIQMGGNITSFRKALLAKRGFRATTKTDPNIYPVKGLFNGRKATFSICVTPKTRKVYSVYVSFDDYLCFDYSSESIKEMQYQMYKKFKSELSSKYGNPYESTTISGSLIVSNWSLKFGDVYLSIDTPSDVPSLRRLAVIYNDKSTTKLNDRETSSDW